MKLKEYLSRLDLNQTEFGKQADLTEGTVRRILKGEHDIALTTALKIEKHTGGVVKCKDLAPDDFKL